METVTLTPIGYVRNAVADRTFHGWDDVESEIVIREDLAPALDGVEEFSHITVLFLLHQVRQEGPKLKIRPRDRAELPEVGVFATHTQFRPNPIGVSNVRLLERRANILRVLGLDAIDGTPVLDIKSYAPALDAPEDVRVPQWVVKLRQAHAREKGKVD